jgi:hypothetical protein
VPALLTNANRSAGREATKQKAAKARAQPELGLPTTCLDCGVVLDDPSRKYCNECFPERRADIVANFATIGPAALARRRAVGTDPAHTEEARRKQGIQAAENVRAIADWERANGMGNIDLDFELDVLAGIRTTPLSSLMSATGLSVRYCSLIRRGLKIPHRRHWRALAALSAAPVERRGSKSN